MNKQQLINQSIDYIIEHLDESLTLEKVAAQFYFSRYYFARLFKEQTGESVYTFIKRMKLEQSAIDLKLKPDQQITDIGLTYGYSSSNYSTVFKNTFAASPKTYRQFLTADQTPNPFILGKLECFGDYQAYQKKIKIGHLPDQRFYYERFIGNYAELKQQWSAFLVKHQGEMNEETLLLEKFYNDPVSADVDHCICDLCFSMDQSRKNTTIVKGGIYAIYPFEGKIDEIFGVLQGIFRIWLPQSSYQMRERFAMNQYLQIDFAKDFVKLKLCIPVEPKKIGGLQDENKEAERTD